MAFISKESTEIIVIDKEVKVVGLSLQKSGLPITFESMGKLWELYGKKYRGKMKQATVPEVEYGVCLNKVPDYVTGCSVTEVTEVNEDCLSYIMPTGKYIKDTFNAQSFEQLVQETIMKRNVKAWAKQNKVKINNKYYIEVYPREAFSKGNFEMYTLTPILE